MKYKTAYERYTRENKCNLDSEQKLKEVLSIICDLRY